MREIKTVGTYTNSGFVSPQDCTVCHNALYGDIIIDGICSACTNSQNETNKPQVPDLQDVLDLLRTGTAPMSFGMTEADWVSYKCNKAAGMLSRIIENMAKSEE